MEMDKDWNSQSKNSKGERMLQTNFGADPELFLVNDGECIPPASLREDFGFDYDKILLEMGDCRIIEDGAAVEINLEPSNNFDLFWQRIERATEGVIDFAKQFDLNVDISPAVKFDPKKFWIDRDETFRDCVRFGCDEDLDVYSGEFSREICVETIQERFGGGHLHIEGDFHDVYFYFTQLCDIFIGNTAVSLKRDSSTRSAEGRRLKYYGQPGKIRLQNYGNNVKGIEYRTPSNFWIKDKENARLLVTMADAVVNLMENPSDASQFINNDSLLQLAISNINNGNSMNTASKARHLFLRVMDSLIEMNYFDLETATSLIEIL